MSIRGIGFRRSDCLSPANRSVCAMAKSSRSIALMRTAYPRSSYNRIATYLKRGQRHLCRAQGNSRRQQFATPTAYNFYLDKLYAREHRCCGNSVISNLRRAAGWSERASTTPYSSIDIQTIGAHRQEFARASLLCVNARLLCSARTKRAIRRRPSGTKLPQGVVDEMT
jgi:hypothetical protein